MRPPKLASIVASFIATVGMTTLFIACSKRAPQTPAPAAAPGASVASADTVQVARAVARPASPLAGLAGQHIVVLPVQYIRPDTSGFAAQITDSRATLAALDSAIERELDARGFGHSWTFPPALARSAKRNAGYVTDPYALAAERLRTGVRASDERLAEPFASQIRSIVAVTDARYALFPVELRFERLADGRMRPLLHVVLLDARGSSVRWAGDVRGATSTGVTPATIESLAFALADLVAAP